MKVALGRKTYAAAVAAVGVGAALRVSSATKPVMRGSVLFHEKIAKCAGATGEEGKKGGSGIHVKSIGL
jgi:hypothetical protein